MSSLKLLHSGGNGVIISAPSSNPAANRTITLNDTYAGDGSFVTANSSGNVGIGTASPVGKFAVSDGTVVAEINPYAASSGAFIGTRSNHAVLFKTNAAERMRIDNNGSVYIGKTAASETTNGFHLSASNGANYVMPSNHYFIFNRNASGAATLIDFRSENTSKGSIAYNGTNIAYNTTSDYRLKENKVTISDGITRLKTLKPYRFNFKSNPSMTVDGFYAHEVTAVPEAVTGTKDETEDILYTEEDTIPSGKKVGDVKETVPKYQGIDQSKLVPLLTAALQEAVAKIEVLETKVAALEGA